MKASTVFALALALLIGLAAAAGAKYAGLFNRKEAAATPVTTPPPYMVLVPRINLYEDYLVTNDQVAARAIRPEEEQYMSSKFGPTWKDKLMPAVQTAAHQRIPRQNLVVDQLLFKEHFHEQGLPDSLSLQLEPNTRAVTVKVAKDDANGGVIRVKEYVDVFLTTRVASGDGEELRTACIAKACKVVMKRNSLWPLMAVDPDGPLPFTLQANLYRATLIDFAKNHGTLSLMPVRDPPKPGGSWSDPASEEYRDEDKRIQEVARGERTIGDDDLIRIFKVKAGPPAPIPSPPHVVEHLHGVSTSGVSVFPTIRPPTAPAPVVPAGGMGSPMGSNGAPGIDAQPNASFRLPSATGATDPGCKNCGTGTPPPPDRFKTIRPKN